MDDAIFDQVLDELFSSLESLETRTRALEQFLKEKGMVADEDFKSYLHQAGEASSVRWRAERVRVNSLLSTAFKNMDDALTAKIEKAMHDPGPAQEKSASGTSAPAAEVEGQKSEPSHSSTSPKEEAVRDDGGKGEAAKQARSKNVKSPNTDAA